ncbi:MAG TPA: hypothetical protein VD997_06575 [Phycisphaerales bacterium]|nr:hypothetical protein [Phycisphaerales bacterium]
MRSGFAMAAVAVLAGAASAQLTQQWATRYTSAGNIADETRGVAVDGAGNVILVGNGRGPTSTNTDSVIVKFGPDGSQQWVRAIGGAANGTDASVSVAVDAAGNIFVGGYVLNNGTSISSRDAFVAKYSSDGNQDWIRTFDFYGREEQPGVVRVTPDGQHVYLGGYVKVGTGAFDWEWFVIKWDGLGNNEWNRVWDGPAGPGQSDQADAGVIDANGNFYMTGSSANTSTSFDTDAAVVGWQPDGTQFYTARWNGELNAGDRGNAIAVDATGVYIAVTANNTASPANTDFALVKFDSTGAVVWERVYDAAGLNDAGLGVTLSGGNVYVGGVTRTASTDADMTVRRYNTSGDLAWTATWNRSAVNGTDSFRNMALLGDRVVMLGTSNNVIGGSFGIREDIATVVVDANSGAVAGAVLYDGAAARGDFSWDVVADAARNRVVVGGHSSGGTTSNYDMLAVAYTPAPVCGTADYNGDGDIGTDQDIEAFFACLGGNCCPTCFAGGADFNADGDIGTDQDIESFFRVLGGGPC